MPPVPTLEEALKIARSLTHSGFTQAKADQVVAAIESALEGPLFEKACDAYKADVALMNTVAEDEIDEDPERLYAIDADDPDGGRNTIPVEALAGCHVMIVNTPEEAAVVDAKYRAENDGDADVGEQGPAEG